MFLSCLCVQMYTCICVYVFMYTFMCVCTFLSGRNREKGAPASQEEFSSMGAILDIREGSVRIRFGDSLVLQIDHQKLKAKAEASNPCPHAVGRWYRFVECRPNPFFLRWPCRFANQSKRVKDCVASACYHYLLPILWKILPLRPS